MTSTDRKRAQIARERASDLVPITITGVPIRIREKLKQDALANGYTLREWCIKKLSA